MVSRRAADSPLDPNEDVDVAGQKTWDPSGFQSSGGQSVEERQAATPQAGGGGLIDHWNTFMDHPENRAGLMQFGINMLAGQGLAGALGGFGEAAGRNIASQEASQKEETEEALKQQEEERKQEETGYYGQAVAKQGEEKPINFQRARMMAQFKNQADFEKYANDLSAANSIGDATLTRMRLKFGKPDLTKAQMMTDPKYAAEAERDWKAHHQAANVFDTMAAQGGGGGPEMPDGSPVYRGGRKFGTWRNGQVVPDAPSE